MTDRAITGDQAELYLRLTAETELRRAIAAPQSASHIPGSESVQSERGLRRLGLAADALAAVGALDTETAIAIMESHLLALLIRRRIDDDHEMFAHRAQPWHPRTPWQFQVPKAPSGQFDAVGLNAAVTVGDHGNRLDVTLLSLVRAPDRTIVAISARLRPAEARIARAARRWSRHQWAFDMLEQGTACDDRGGSHRLSFSGGGGDDAHWSGYFDVDPLPGPELRWLDITFAPGAPAVRVPLASAPPQASAPPMASAPLMAWAPSQAEAITKTGQAGRAERYLDMIAEHLLSHGSCDSDGDDGDLDDLTHVLAALRAVGALGPDSQALRRIATVGRRLRLPLTAGLADAADTELPPHWLGVLDHGEVADGPAGFATSAAAVLPEVDGSRWALTSLSSTARSATVAAVGWGIASDDHLDHFSQYVSAASPAQFSWWALDGAGRWHLGTSESGSWSSEGHADAEIVFFPALHPAATTLEIVLIGRTGQASVTVPLDWRPAP